MYIRPYTKIFVHLVKAQAKSDFKNLEKEKVAADQQAKKLEKQAAALQQANKSAAEDIAAKDAQIEKVKNMFKDKLTEVVTKAQEVNSLTSQLGKFYS